MVDTYVDSTECFVLEQKQDQNKLRCTIDPEFQVLKWAYNLAKEKIQSYCVTGSRKSHERLSFNRNQSADFLNFPRLGEILSNLRIRILY